MNAVTFAVIVALVLALAVTVYADSPVPGQVVPPATQGPPGVTPTIVCKARCDVPEPPAIMTATPTAGQYRVWVVEVDV